MVMIFKFALPGEMFHLKSVFLKKKILQKVSVPGNNLLFLKDLCLKIFSLSKLLSMYWTIFEIIFDVNDQV